MYDSPEFIRAFLDEVDEQLELFEKNILNLERDPNDEIIRALFRIAHTLKGSSAAVGFEKMKTLTHKMEDVLDRIRTGKIKVTKPLIDVLFRCLDELKTLKEEFSSKGNNIKTDITLTLSELHKYISGDQLLKKTVGAEINKEFKLDLEQQIQIQQAVASGLNVFVCEVKIKKDCVMKAVRAFLILNFLNQLGTVIKSEPDMTDMNDNIDVESISYLLITEFDKEQLKVKVLDRMLEIESFNADLFDLSLIQSQSDNGCNVTKDSGYEKQNTNEIRNKTNQTVRVDIGRLEKMMEMVGELVIEKSRISQIVSLLHERYSSDNSFEDLEEISNQISRITNELQELVLKVRMLPIKQLFSRIPRLVRDLADSLHKEIELVIEGEDTELDKTIIEDLADPLVHLIRNAADHGIEAPDERLKAGKNPKGTIRVNAYHQENQFILVVQDDGRGINLNKVKEVALKKGIISRQESDLLNDKEVLELIFKPGFSTSQSISDISGRGVGMDIVRNNINKLNGVIEVETKEWEGTKFIIKLPLTLAILNGLLIRINNEIYAIPVSNVIEIVRLNEKEIKKIKNQDVVIIRERTISLIWLHDYFKVRRNIRNKNIVIVILGIAEKRFGLVVDELIGNQEIVVKNFGSYIGKLDIFSGATILGDGNVACILDVAGIVKTTAFKKSYDKEFA
ncbi:CheA signal transduction histidine kinase [Thermoanaerobacterium aotearoense SCUT27]|uniref:Chemotaxis protein CheA n=2 Tax=Thermoanaerobacterium TaxID=28895 RepID=W9EC06_9THEO|nr:CheA signal transduction histidine kinase [Thermoanaerobacterium saccharolyticum JW/SL-YS485]ETO39658.1 CheA signal transduction histidine kinase [Thermoanaerobacterium aotearoense SCUT27]